MLWPKANQFFLWFILSRSDVAPLQQGHLLVIHPQFKAESFSAPIPVAEQKTSLKESNVGSILQKNGAQTPCFLSEQKEFVPKSPAFIWFFQGSLKHDVWNESCLGVTLPECFHLLLSAQSTSTGPSALTSIHERSRVTKVLLRKEGSMWEGTNRSTKCSFPLHVRSPSGDSVGVTDITVVFFSTLPSFFHNENCCLPF